MAYVHLRSSLLTPSTKVVRCNSATVAFKRDLHAEPPANSGVLAEVQTQSQENPRYSLQGVHLAGAGESSTILSFADLYALSKINYDGTNAPVLNIVYGPVASSTALVGYAGSSSINVVVENWNLNVDARDSKDAYRPSLTINLLETS